MLFDSIDLQYYISLQFLGAKRSEIQKFFHGFVADSLGNRNRPNGAQLGKAYLRNECATDANETLGLYPIHGTYTVLP